MKAIVFTDGSPGHEKQSWGIIKALQNYIKVDVTELSIAKSQLLDNISAHFAYFCNFSPDVRSPVDKDCDLLIGTGSHTHLPILNAKKRCGAKAVICMAPMKFIRNRFDLCCIPYHDRVLPADNIFQTIGPPTIASSVTEKDPLRALVLVGGEDHRSHYWESKRIVADIESLIRGGENLQWTVSSSPRTPEDTELLLEELASGLDNAQFLSFTKTEPGWVEARYNENETVWISADSISMVYEALSAGCKVGILPVQWKSKRNKFQSSIEVLQKERRVVSLKQYQENETRWTELDPLNEADRCAKEILKRWWPTRLP